MVSLLTANVCCVCCQHLRVLVHENCLTQWGVKEECVEWTRVHADLAKDIGGIPGSIVIMIRVPF